MIVDKFKIINLYGNDIIRKKDLSWTSQYDYEMEEYYWVRTDSRKFFVKDHLGSIRQTLNTSGVVQSAMDYYAFGGTMSSYVNGNTVDKYKFTGKERDLETGLDYFGARYYDSKICRWMSVDPFADKYSGWSPYNYALNNPLVLIDPDGNEPIDEHEKPKQSAASKRAHAEAEGAIVKQFVSEHHSEIATVASIAFAVGAATGVSEGIAAGLTLASFATGVADAVVSYNQGDGVGAATGTVSSFALLGVKSIPAVTTFGVLAYGTGKVITDELNKNLKPLSGGENNFVKIHQSNDNTNLRPSPISVHKYDKNSLQMFQCHKRYGK